MTPLPIPRHLPAWLVLWAWMLATVLPALAPSAHAGQRSDWVEVCTTQGAKWVALDESGTPSPQPADHLLQHCPACAHHAQALALPPAPDLLWIPADLRHAMPQAFLRAPVTPHAWRSAQARAPPALT